jgi:hypothetical protein
LGSFAPFLPSSFVGFVDFVDSLGFARFEGLGSVVGRVDLGAEAPPGPSLRFKPTPIMSV